MEFRVIELMRQKFLICFQLMRLGIPVYFVSKSLRISGKALHILKCISSICNNIICVF